MKRYNELDRDDIMFIWLAVKLSSRPVALHRLLREYPDASYIAGNLDAVHREFPRLMRETDLKRLRDDVPEAFFERLYKRMKAADMFVLLSKEDGYLNALRGIDKAPSVLFARGQPLEGRAPLICVVGTRKYTQYGKTMTEKLAGDLAKSGSIIVSGMALGIDALAAEAALMSRRIDCATIAVMPGGADVCYPSANRALYESILEDGTVLSAYEPGTRPRDFRFVERNYLMAAISDSVVLIEGGEKSGALITARRAIGYGRPVFCVPGRTSDPMSAAPNALIASGEARAIHSASDIIEAMNITPPESDALLKSSSVSSKPHDGGGLSELAPNERAVCSALENAPKTFDELLDTTGIGFAALNMALTSLEFSRIIKQMHGGLYSLHE